MHYKLDARVFWTLLMCLRVHASGRSRGRRVGRECESEIFTYLFCIIVILNVPSWAHVSKDKKKKKKNLLCIIMNNKDLFDLIWFEIFDLIWFDFSIYNYSSLLCSAILCSRAGPLRSYRMWFLIARRCNHVKCLEQNESQSACAESTHKRVN